MLIAQPPITTNAKGQLRKAGFELEYTGISLPDTASLLQTLFGGKIEEEHKSSYRVADTAYGTFTVMFDAAMFQRLSADVAQERAANAERDSLKALAERLLSPLAAGWVPNEIVTPPIPLDRLSEMERLTEALRDAGAKGTGASPIYAYGMHINPELPGVPPEQLRDYIAAFVLLQERLQVEGEMDLARRLSQFAKLFPSDYCEFVLQPGYRPDFETLIEDYVAFNPTRNRALDMLPAFSELAPGLMAQLLDDGLTQARPTFHYRLPNCSLDKPDWSILDEWALWVSVEALAEDKERLAAMSQAYLA